MGREASDLTEAQLNAIIGSVFLNHLVRRTGVQSSDFAGASARGSAWTSIPWNEGIAYEQQSGKPAPAPYGYDGQRPRSGPLSPPGNQSSSDAKPAPGVGRSRYAPDPPLPPQPAKSAEPFAGKRATGATEF